MCVCLCSIIGVVGTHVHSLVRNIFETLHLHVFRHDTEVVSDQFGPVIPSFQLPSGSKEEVIVVILRQLPVSLPATCAVGSEHPQHSSVFLRGA